MSNGNTGLHSRMRTGLEYMGKCTFRGELYDLGRYPGFKSNPDSVSHGELYKIIDDGLLPFLDEYEAIDNENPSLPGFIRNRIELLNPKLDAWIYCYDGKVTHASLLKTGRWLKP